MTYLLASIAGGLGGMLISWLMGLYGSRRGGNLGHQQLIFNEGRTVPGAPRVNFCPSCGAPVRDATWTLAKMADA